MITLIGGDLYQWDTGRVIFIAPDSGYEVHEVHFTTKKMDYAYVVKTYVENGGTYCAIPNILLQQYQDVVCYEVRENDAGEESISTTTFDVIKRNRPVDYVYTEPEKYTYKEIENRVAALESKIEEIKNSSTESSVVANQAYEIAESVRNTTTTLSEQLEELSNTTVKTINNLTPDENGNIVIETGTGGSGNVTDTEAITTAKQEAINAAKEYADTLSKRVVGSTDEDGNVVIMLDEEFWATK